LNAGDTVKPALQFNLGANQSMGSYFGAASYYGNWLGATDKYLGLSFIVGPSSYYGWARLDVDSTASQFIIKDYAYNATPNAYIIAGETGVGIHENTLNDALSIYSSDKNVFINYRKEFPNNSANVKITDVLGKNIYEGTLTNRETKINLNEAKTGIYFVTVIQNNGVFTKKVHIQ
jgi:hypothetical protein